LTIFLLNAKKYVDNRHPSFLLGGDGFEIGVKQHNIYNIWDQKKSPMFFSTQQNKQSPTRFCVKPYNVQHDKLEQSL
jgi:hypothetical protein